MSNKRFSSWCQSVLPANYRQIKNSTYMVQCFLGEQLPDNVLPHIQVINVSDTEIVVAVDDPQITNFLRLHHREIQQQLHETFSDQQILKLKTMPGSLLKIPSKQAVRKPRKVSSEAVQSVKRQARWIEDEGLKQALESLAEKLQSKNV